MNNFITLLAILFALNIYAADSPEIKAEKSHDFALNLEYLNDGNIQFFADIYDIHEFMNAPEKIRGLDVSNFRNDDKNYFVLYKFAFTIPTNNNTIFDNNLYSKDDFLMANNKGLIDVERVSKNNLLKLTLEGRKIGFVRTEPTVFYVQFSELNSLSSSLIKVVENLFERNLSKPRTMFCQTLKSEQKIFVGGITIASYYHLEENKSLVIFYKLATLKPNFLIKSAIKVGLASLFFDMEREDARKSVQKTRECVGSDL